MTKTFLPAILCCLLMTGSCYARTYTEAEGRAAWAELRRQPLNETNFRLACDLMQDIAQTNIRLAYTLLEEYLPVVRQTGNRQWVHVILMGWAKAKESFAFFDEAEALYRQARDNTLPGTRLFDEALVGTVLMYSEWGKADSLEKYAAIGENSCLQSGDDENRSFIFTFRGVSRTLDTGFMRRSLDTAIRLATPLVNKNALFTALYNKATIYSQYNPQLQANILESLLQLSKDPTFNHKPRLYERTAFYFRNPVPSVYYQLIQVNMLLTDYDNASRFAELFYDATIKPNPAGAQAPYFNAELALVKANQGDFIKAKEWLQISRTLFNLPTDSIPNSAWYLASGMLAEHEKRYDSALYFFQHAVQIGSTYGRHYLQPALYYAHALTLTHRLPEAAAALAAFSPVARARRYSALGYYYYQYYAAWLKAKGDYPAYAAALDTFYLVKDSLLSLNHYRVIQQVNTRVQLHDKEQQLLRVNEERALEQKNSHKERLYLLGLLGLSALSVLLLLAYIRHQRLRKKQAEQITIQREELRQKQLEEMKQQHALERMESAVRAEESERIKIAGELHDEAGTLLSLASLNISSVIEKGLYDGNAPDRLEKVRELLASVSGNIRNLSHRLTPPVIEQYGFRKVIDDMTYTVNLSGKIKLETVVIGFDDTGKYPVAFLNALYRMIMELINNVLKHAKASWALLELVEHGDTISILVEDNGIGIKTPPATGIPHIKGKGIDAIQSKIAYLNGRMETTQKKEGGTLVVIEIPS